MITQRKISAMSGVSYPTVNRILNGCPSVRPALRERVLEVVRVTGYRKNMLASGLSRRRTMALGMVMTNNPHSFWMEVLNALEQGVRSHGYHVVICHPSDPGGQIGEEIRFLMERQVDGLIVSPSPCVDDIDAYRSVIKSGVPLLFMSNNVPNIGAHYLGSTSRKGAREASAYLVSLGHRRVGFLRGTGDACEQRFEGYCDTMERNNLTPMWVQADGNRLEHGRDAAMPMLTLNPRPTAVFAATDPLAIGVFQHLRASGLQVPDDMSLIGYAGMAEGEWLATPLTTVRQDAARLGVRAGQLMMELIVGNHVTPVTEEIEDQLLLRSSCATPRTTA